MPTTILDTDPVLVGLCRLAAELGYRVEFGDDELVDPSVNAGVCVYSKQLIQVAKQLASMPDVAQWILLHEVAHAVLHDAYANDDGYTSAVHEAEANTVRKLVWPLLNGYRFSYGRTLDTPPATVVDAARRVLMALELPTTR